MGQHGKTRDMKITDTLRAISLHISLCVDAASRFHLVVAAAVVVVVAVVASEMVTVEAVVLFVVVLMIMRCRQLWCCQ